MIIVLKEADFSDNNIGQIVIPEEINPFTTAAITASGNSFTNVQTQAINRFFKSIGAFDNTGIFAKLGFLYLPMLAVDVSKAFVNYKDNTSIEVNNTRYQLRNKGVTGKSGGSGDWFGISNYTLDWSDFTFLAYTTEQLTWFTSEALKVDAGWSIIVFTHSLYYVNTVEQLTVVSGAQPFIDAIDHYNGSGNIACVLMGHAHKDRIHIGETGVPYILSACDRYSPYHGDINVNRTLGTISEQHFEVVVIDKGKRLIKLFSFGANARDGYDDNPGEEVDVRVVTY